MGKWNMRFYPKTVQDFYIDYMKKTRLNEVPLEKRAEWVALRNMLIRAIHDEGGKIMAGSDTPEFLWLYGYSLHRELQALRDAGLSNYTVLEAATKNPALFLGTITLSGTIEKGKRADMVLLNANPLEDIGNTMNRDGVMLGGKYYPQSLLNKWLDEIAPRIVNSYTQ
jgi:imidazolonepropionase-like amidohydrolase